MIDADWITDRPPTAADADGNGKVLAQMPCGFLKGKPWSIFLEWDQVPASTPWRHGQGWKQLDPLPAREVA